jgi:hypothetical protein
MPKLSTKQIIIGVSAILISGVLIYTFFIRGSGAIPVDVLVPVSDQSVGQDILVLVDKFKSVSIDPSLFSSTLFTTLKDSSVPLNPESQGRVNPFANIGVEK